MITPLRTTTVCTLRPVVQVVEDASGQLDREAPIDRRPPVGVGLGVIDDDDDLRAAEADTAAVEQSQHGVGTQERLFGQQIARAAVGVAVVEHRLDLGVDTVLQAQHGLGVPGRRPAAHPGVAIDPRLEAHRPTLPLQPLETIAVAFESTGFGAYRAGELVGRDVFGDQHQPRRLVDQALPRRGFELAQRPSEDVDMCPRHPPRFQRGAELGGLLGGLGAMQHSVRLDAGSTGRRRPTISPGTTTPPPTTERSPPHAHRPTISTGATNQQRSRARHDRHSRHRQPPPAPPVRAPPPTPSPHSH